ncbi:kinase-like protein [Gigaspora margarita]|uniref:Kinase-like protein n=2 Tax=Gigaspora margarita TaxID=4874 RepID=A0A8H3XC64_GIGMA|nr:kinase-like protein [Gigaspora margarita]
MSSQTKEKKESTNNTTEGKNSAGENRGKFNTSSGVVNAIQTVGDAVQPFVPLFSMVTNIVQQLSQIYENAKCNQKICLVLVERVEIAQYAVKSLQRQKQANEEKFRNQKYYYAFVRFVNVLENIKKFAKEITQLSCFQKFINANAIKDAFDKNIKEFEDVCSDLHFTIAMYDVERREQEAKNVAEDIDVLNKSMNEVKSNLKVVMNEVAALASSMENLNIQASRSAGRATTMRTPLNEAYKAPTVDPNQLNEPFASDDNVRGSRKTVVKKLFRGLEVACKKVPNIENNDTAQSQKGQTELIILLKLGTLCPNVVTFYGLSKVDNNDVMVFNWTSYGNLKEMYTKYEIKWPLKLKFARDICNGLVFVHQCNILHHDVRCENILITDSHEAKLSNFELSRTVQGLSAEVKNLLDIVRWLAPEKMRVTKGGAEQRYNHQCEMFSFGMLLWELCHQRIPYKDMNSVTAIQEHVMSKKRETLKIALCPLEIPNELAKIIKKAWQDEPSARPSDLEVQLKLKELYERFQETSPQIRPKDPHCDIEIPYVELTESEIEMPCDLTDYSIPPIQTLMPFEDGIKEHKAKNYKVSWECFVGHADLGNNVAKYWKGYYLLTGLNGQKNPEAALRLFKEAADNGVADAQLRYAFALIENKSKNVAEIMKYMMMAADYENSTALFNLGDIYWNGKLGIPIDKEKAESYTRLAALKNQPKAIALLEQINAEKMKKT